MMSVFHLHFATWWGHGIQLRQQCSSSQHMAPVTVDAVEYESSKHALLSSSANPSRTGLLQLSQHRLRWGRIDIFHPEPLTLTQDSEPSSLLFAQQILFARSHRNVRTRCMHEERRL